VFALRTAFVRLVVSRLMSSPGRPGTGGDDADRVKQEGAWAVTAAGGWPVVVGEAV
jgi:hypothetical protein